MVFEKALNFQDDWQKHALIHILGFPKDKSTAAFDVLLNCLQRNQWKYKCVKGEESISETFYYLMDIPAGFSSETKGKRAVFAIEDKNDGGNFDITRLVACKICDMNRFNWKVIL